MGTFKMIYIDLLVFAYIECDKSMAKQDSRLDAAVVGMAQVAGFSLNILTNLASRVYEHCALIGTWCTFLISNVLK